MNKEFKPLDLYKINSTSYMKLHYYENCVKMVNDEKKKQRLLEQECQVCYYNSRMGGCAMTTWHCGLCGKLDMHGSTATDTLCLECAKKENLCKSCGGTISMGKRYKQLCQD